MAPDTPAREPEMQDTPPCRCPKSGDAVRISAFFVSNLDTAVLRIPIIKHPFPFINPAKPTKFLLFFQRRAGRYVRFIGRALRYNPPQIIQR